MTPRPCSQAYNPSEALSTPLLLEEPTIDLATRVARLLARKTKTPVYVSSSMSFAETVLGGSIEEEMAAFRDVMALVVDKIGEVRGHRSGGGTGGAAPLSNETGAVVNGKGGVVA